MTLILAPLVASFGVPVAKMSGRGLGHTGGTIDKLESIKGYQVERSQERFYSSGYRILVYLSLGNQTSLSKRISYSMPYVM